METIGTDPRSGKCIAPSTDGSPYIQLTVWALFRTLGLQHTTGMLHKKDSRDSPMMSAKLD